VLSAIDFDNQVAFAAYEIADVPADGFLTNKLTTRQLPTAKVAPELSFRVGL
jgi:hypothetical protein